MAEPLVSDELWEMIGPLLPPPQPRRFRYPGRKPLDRRDVLRGILFVLRSGIPWEMLPQEMGCGSGMTCWRYLQKWQQQGVWQRIHEALLAKLRDADAIDWSRAVVDSASVRAVLGGLKPVPTPRIGAKRAASTTSSRMRKAFRWQRF
jgi:transposase